MPSAIRSARAAPTPRELPAPRAPKAAPASKNAKAAKPERPAPPPKPPKPAKAAKAPPPPPVAKASKLAKASPPQAPQAAQAPQPTVAPAPTAAASRAPALTSVAASTGSTQSEGGMVVGGGEVVVDIKSSDSGYENQIFWSTDNFATRHFLGVDNHTGSVSLGSFTPGTRIDFAIVNGENQFFRTGGAAANSDSISHTRSTESAAGRTIGFEDLRGGGDRDFNDAIITVQQRAPSAAAVAAPSSPIKPSSSPSTPPVATQTPEPKPATPPTTGTSSGNRSGLGDGSNPGQGAGRENSPNAGTDNPAKTPSASASAANLYATVASFDKPSKAGGPADEHKLKDVA